MFTQFVLKLLNFQPLLRYFGSIPLVYNKQEMSFSLDKRALEKESRNFAFFLLWVGLSCIILARFYLSANFDELNQTLPFWLSIVLISVTYSIVTCFPVDFCRMSNGIFTFIPQLKRKFKSDKILF